MLAQHFTVVTVEPLGYGLSDETGDELEGFIGIDTSVPGMDQNIPEVMQKAEDMLPYIIRFKQKTGMLRLSLWRQQGKQTGSDMENQLTDCEKKIQKWCMMCRWWNKTLMNEVKNTLYNMEKTSGMKFSSRVPVLFLLSKKNTELIPDWEELHRNIIEEQFYSQVEVLDGDHYLYNGKESEIAETVRDWAKRIEKKEEEKEV